MPYTFGVRLRYCVETILVQDEKLSDDLMRRAETRSCLVRFVPDIQEQLSKARDRV